MRDGDEVLRELQGIVASRMPRQEALQAVAGAIRWSGGHRSVGLYVADVARGVVSNLVWDGLGAPEYPEFAIGKGLTGRAIASRGSINVGKVLEDADYLTALGSTRSEIIVPVLRADGASVLGTIDVESEVADAFSLGVQRMLEACAEVIRPLWLNAGETNG
jgi:putative methionine-R-sulfoxide reductase with GAF domain